MSPPAKGVDGEQRRERVDNRAARWRKRSRSRAARLAVNVARKTPIDRNERETEQAVEEERGIVRARRKTRSRWNVECIEGTGGEGAQGDPHVSKEVVDRKGLCSHPIRRRSRESGLLERTEGTHVGASRNDPA